MLKCAKPCLRSVSDEILARFRTALIENIASRLPRVAKHAFANFSRVVEKLAASRGGRATNQNIYSRAHLESKVSFRKELLVF